MKVALFVPCYIDQFYPRVARASLELLEKLGVEVEVPLDQTCCGQPMANAGFESSTRKTTEQFVRNFAGYDYIVGPSGSCVLHVREHVQTLVPGEAARQVHDRIFELCEFLHRVLKVERLEAKFPHRVGLHLSCHGQRGMRLAQSSERVGADFSVMRDLLQLVQGVELVELARADECCGFGGTFSVSEEAVSVRMGKDRLADHLAHGAEVITAGDMSCLMHLEGIIRRERYPLRAMHIAEILNASTT